MSSGTSASRPAFSDMLHHYPHAGAWPRQKLFREIGWTDLANKKEYEDTCALRLSLALVGCNILIPHARFKLKNGALKNKWVEPGQAKLSATLEEIWGMPEVFDSELAAQHGIGSRRGVVSFYSIYGVGSHQGHIDLIWPAGNSFFNCAMSCYMGSIKIKFWQLQ
jgi:hypothetical protein